jgi:pyrimidine-nucleoside phosphorylase
MRPTDIIMKKRGTFIRSAEGKQTLTGSTTLTREEIKFLIDGYVAGTIPEYQVSAWLMAVYFNGMSFEETGWLTDAMLHSGDVIDLHGSGIDGLTGPFVDKHSTGGVGDKISLPLAPIVACCGLQVPMMSGRALGHTGGTLDKLESIEGYKVGLTPDMFRSLIAKTGFAMTGQTKEIVPADRLLYALRDVTGTVESIPLITASILSKKVAEGADALVFDVKYGSGAFMKSIPDAEMLASFLVKTAGTMGKKASALITNMDTPLGWKVGNFLEIEETLECLQGHGPEDVMDETYALGAEMLLLGRKAVSKEDGITKCKAAVTSGKALSKFLENVQDQGGNPEKLLSEQGKRRSPFHVTFRAKQDGYICMDAYLTGLAGVDLGVGRSRTTDPVCPDAGFILHAKTGSCVKAGDAVMEVYGKDEACLVPACARLEKAVSYVSEKPEDKPLIYKEIHQ